MFQITTVYPDGRSEARDATPEEVAQAEADRQAAAAMEAERVALSERREQARLSARARLKTQGFTDAEIDVMYPSLIG